MSKYSKATGVKIYSYFSGLIKIVLSPEYAQLVQEPIGSTSCRFERFSTSHLPHQLHVTTDSLNLIYYTAHCETVCRVEINVVLNKWIREPAPAERAAGIASVSTKTYFFASVSPTTS